MSKKTLLSLSFNTYHIRQSILLLSIACSITLQTVCTPFTAHASTNAKEDTVSMRNPFLPYTTPGNIIMQNRSNPPVSDSNPSKKGEISPISPPTHLPSSVNNEIFSYKILPLNYTSAENISKTVQGLGFKDISIDKATNSLLYKGSEKSYNDLQALVQKLDTATPQVTLEAKIIAINRESGKEIGLNWQWDSIPQRNNKNESNYSSSGTTSSDSDNFGGNWKIWHGYGMRFGATLNALISQGKAKILATPHIITIPGREASIFIGDHIPVQTEKHTSSSTYTATEYVDAGIKLQYTPIISQDHRMVTAAVHTEVSTPTLVSEIKNYRVTSRTADTNVRMYSGETLVIGGLINEEEQKTLQQIPLLSKIPLLGELFKNRTTKKNKVEVIMLLTPHITEAGHSPVIYDDYAKEMMQRQILK